MNGVLKKLQYIENLIIVISFAVMVICSFSSVINRNFIKLSLPWLDELSTFAMIYMVLLGTEAGLRDGSQIAVTAVVNKFSGLSKALVQALAKGGYDDFFGRCAVLQLLHDGCTSPIRSGNGSVACSNGDSLFCTGNQLCHYNLRTGCQCHYDDCPSQNFRR